MVGTSKILTVSYGTFSCTLEGFDDSFETMKAIAEYFRDLAADDRYFGAEPPTPDADMLARIAEREVSRRVQAHEEQGRVVLRASEDAAPSAESEPEPAAAPEADHPAAAPALSAPPDADADDSVAAKLRRIRAVTATAQVQQTAEAYDEEEASFLDTTVADLDAALRMDDDSAPRPPDWFEPGVPVAPESEAPAAATETAPKEPEEETAGQEAPGPSAAPAPDTAPQEEPAAGDAAEVEAEPEVMTDEAWSDPAIPADEDLWTASDYESVEIADEDVPAGDDSIEDTLAQLMADALRDEPEAPGESTSPSMTVEVEADDPLDHAAATADSGLDTDAENAGEPDPGETEAHPAPAADVVSMKDSEPDADLSGAGATVEDDTPATEPEETAAGTGTTQDRADTEPATLSPEDEADLQRELAEVEAELSGDAAPEETPTATAAHPAAASDRGEAAAGTDVARIFDETEAQLETPDSHERRAAIRHMRRAVTAAEAERRAGSDMSRDIDDEPYRLDLADVVDKPRRRERPQTQEPRLAPLKLVAEQRIDRPREPIQPRRVAKPEPALPDQSDGQGFSAFAAAQGAHALPELLEAAAAYMADVEGRDQFSRPMLMHKLREVEAEGFSREEGLRSFGQLLRSGKLQKLKGGRFTVTDSTEYRPAARSAG